MNAVIMAAMATAAISAAGTILAAWVQGRAQRPRRTDRDSRSDDRQ